MSGPPDPDRLVHSCRRSRLRPVLGVALVRQAHLLQWLLALPERLQSPLQLCHGDLFGRQWTEVKIAVRHDVGARSQGRHFTIADVRHPRLPNALADFGDLWQIERIVGRVACDGRDGHRQPEGVECREGNLQLRQVRPVILTVTKLEQTVRRHIGRDGRRIDAHGFRVQIVDANERLVEFAFACDPRGHHAQGIEPPRQPIISAIARQDLLVHTATERLLMRRDPRLNM